MKELLFVLKVFVVSILLVIILQLKVGDLTLEERAQGWIHSSWITQQIQLAGDGLQKLIGQLTGDLGKKISSAFSKDEGSSRASKLRVERSESYLKAQEAAVSQVDY